VTAASEDAIRSGGQVSNEQIEALGRLARLVELSDVAQPPAARQRRAVLTAFGGTLLIGVLLLTGPSQTEIELDLEVSGVDFVLSQRSEELPESMGLSTLGVTGLRAIPAPCAGEAEDQASPSPEVADVDVKLSAAHDGSRAGSIMLEPLPLPAGTHVGISYERPDGYRLSLSSERRPSGDPQTSSNLPRFRANLDGPVEMKRSGERQRLEHEMPTGYCFDPSHEVDLNLKLLSTAKSDLTEPLSVSRLSFLKAEAQDAKRPRSHRMSTIHSGSLFFEALNGEERKLRPGEVIEFKESEGELRALELDQDRIVLRFHGSVSGIRRGAGENSRSLMPTWLDWLRARHGGLSVLWGVVIYIFGLIITVFRWFGRST
jgi:hypothetical protein